MLLLLLWLVLLKHTGTDYNDAVTKALQGHFAHS